MCFPAGERPAISVSWFSVSPFGNAALYIIVRARTWCVASLLWALFPRDVYLSVLPGL